MIQILLFKKKTFLKSQFWLLFFVGCIHLYAQAISPGSAVIKLKVSQSTVGTFFRTIEDQTSLIFVFSNDQIDLKQIIHFSNKSAVKLDSLLGQTLKGQGYVWTYKEHFIVLRKSDNRSNTYGQFTDSVITISGIIMNEDGKPIPGATIILKNGKVGALSNEKGEFKLANIPNNISITISSLGYQTQIINVLRSNNNLSIVLKSFVNKLDETVVAAYTTTSLRKNVGGGISTISSTTIGNKPVTNPLLALQGEVPGVFITQATGLSNSGVVVQIRGQNSFAAGNNPLYVIDGVPYTSSLLPSTSGYYLGSSGTSSLDGNGSSLGNPLSFINPASIESISVLKDADATSIYGSRAASGAIIITTKKGKVGKTKINVNIQSGGAKITRGLKLMNTQQYLSMRHQAKINDDAPIYSTDYDLNGTWDTTRNVDWFKELLDGTSIFSDYQLSITGGSLNTQFLIAGGFHRESPMFLNAPGGLKPGNQKGSLNFNISNISNNQKFKTSFSGSFMKDVNNVPIDDFSTSATKLAPVAPRLFNTDGSLNWELDSNGVATWTNPLSNSYVKNRIATNNLIGNMLLSYELLPGLIIKSSLGYTDLRMDEIQSFPSLSVSPDYRPYFTRYAYYTHGYINSWIVEPQISYRKKIGINDIEFLLGSTFHQNNVFQENYFGQGFSSDLSMDDPKSASSFIYNSTLATTYKYNALFGLINYNLKKKYYVSLSARRDGSSRFGSDNLFNNFWSIAGAYIFSDENWIRNNASFLSFGKLRASYGTTGNDQIGEYKFLPLYYNYGADIPYQNQVGLTPNSLPNPKLQWEETRKLQLGLDLGFINDRVLINLNYYRNRSSNQLLGFALPTQTGFASITSNFPAKVQNSGFEVTVNTINTRNRKINWSSSLNLTIPRNKLIAFPGIEKSPYADSYILGKSLSIVKLYKYSGIDSTTGLFSFKDSHGNSTSSPSYDIDRTEIIDMAPQFFGGISNTVSYKGFQLDILLQCSSQNGADGRLGFRPGVFYQGVINQPSFILDKNNHQKFTTRYSGPIGAAYSAASNSDLIYSRVFYLRFKTISLSWQCPPEWISKMQIQDLKIYAHSQNLFTISNYLGTDPENRKPFGLGPFKTFTFGIQATL